MDIFKPQSHFYSIGFRPLFFLAAMAAIIFPTFWVSIYFNYMKYHSTLMTSFNWHSHEMLFAFPWALFAGFVLTASSNWTGKSPINGKVLMALTFLWILGRVGLILPLDQNLNIVAMILHMLFPVLFTAVLGNYLWGYPKQFYVFIPVFVLFSLADLLMLSGNMLFPEIDTISISQDFALALIRFMLILISSRVMPFFSNKRFPEINVVKTPKLDYTTLIFAGLLCLPLNLFLTELPRFILFFVLAVLLSIKLVKWKFIQTCVEPMLCILHLGVFWIIVNLLLEAWALVNPAILFTNAPLHALTAGAIGTFSLGIMARVSLGHTGREIKVDKVILAAFISMFVGAFQRVIIPVIQPALFLDSLHHASGWWCLAFCLFLYRITPYLFAPHQKL